MFIMALITATSSLSLWRSVLIVLGSILIVAESFFERLNGFLNSFGGRLPFKEGSLNWNSTSPSICTNECSRCYLKITHQQTFIAINLSTLPAHVELSLIVV
ncbi:hypothetical protein EV426DRAFT_604032 [Tirmania nivea]|nr:hypothetical protein EV426DRAFT_604032 [Tirmania nivea]